MEAFVFLQEKKDGTTKGRTIYNGKPTREWLSREDSAIPTAALESTFLTSTIDAKEERDVMSADVPNAFIQTPMPDDNKKVIMKITGVLVHLMVEQAPEVYGPHVMHENGKKVLYVAVLKALHGMLVSSLRLKTRSMAKPYIRAPLPMLWSYKSRCLRQLDKNTRTQEPKKA